MLTDKEQQAFVDWYIARYYPDGTVEIPYPLPVLPKDKEEEERKAREDFFISLLGKKKANTPYTHRGGRKDTVLGKIMEGLWLGYGPVFR